MNLEPCAGCGHPEVEHHGTAEHIKHGHRACTKYDPKKKEYCVCDAYVAAAA